MTAVFSLLFISSGIIFSSIAAKHNFADKVDYSSGDINILAKAKTGAELYADNMRRELNYTWNMESIDLGENAGGFSWEDKRYPSSYDLETKLENRIKNEPDKGLVSQSRLEHCSPPGIDSVVFRSNNWLRLNLKSKSVLCKSYTSNAKAYFDQDIYVNNEHNNYLNIADYAVKLADKSEEITPGTMAAYDYEEDCPASSSSVKSSSKSKARSSAIQKDLADKAYSQTSSDRPHYIEATMKKVGFDGSYTDNLDDNTVTCTYNVYKDIDNDGKAEKVPKTGDGYKYNYTYSVDKVTFSYNLRDTENTIFTPDNPEDRINFRFDYIRHLQ